MDRLEGSCKEVGVAEGPIRTFTDRVGEETRKVTAKETQWVLSGGSKETDVQ